MVLDKTLESPLDYKEIQPVHSEGDQPWDFFGRNDAKAETPVLWRAAAPVGVFHEARRGSQGASRAVPGKSGLCAGGERERVMALESW